MPHSPHVHTSSFIKRGIKEHSPDCPRSLDRSHNIEYPYYRRAGDTPTTIPSITRVTYTGCSPEKVSYPVRIRQRDGLGVFTEEYKVEGCKHDTYHSPPRCRSPIRSITTVKHPIDQEVLDDFIELITLERELEFAKQALVNRYDFTMNDAFKIFDFSRKGLITDANIRDTFHDYQVYITLSEANRIHTRYDYNLDGYLSFDEFVEMFAPNDPYSNGILSDRSAKYPDGYYSTPTLVDPTTCAAFSSVLSSHAKVADLAFNIKRKRLCNPIANKHNLLDDLNYSG